MQPWKPLLGYTTFEWTTASAGEKANGLLFPIMSNVPLAPINLFRRIITVFATQFRGLDCLAIDTGGAGRRLPHAVLSRRLRRAFTDLDTQGIHNLLPDAVIAILGEVIIDGTLVQQVVGQVGPLA